MRAEPRELLISPTLADDPLFAERLHAALPKLTLTLREGERPATDAIAGLAGAPALIAETPAAAAAAGLAMGYLAETQCGRTEHIGRIAPLADGPVMRLDEATKRNLEIVRTMPAGEREGSLVAALDKTRSAAGARTLKRWLLSPLVDPAAIRDRHEAVATILGDEARRRAVREGLARVYDIERIVGRIAARAANARDLIALGESLAAAGALRDVLAGLPGLLGELAERIDPLPELSGAIAERIADEPPLSLREGGLIRTGFSPELDEMRERIGHGKDFIARIEERERAATGIPSLKVKFNKVFGYYLEVTNAHRAKVPERYIRKQTLVNAERFITPELKEEEERILGAQERSRALEYELFLALRERAAEAAGALLATADALAILDVLAGFAQTAHEHRYVQPTVDAGAVVDIREGRHPIVERQRLAERFVPNDVRIDGAGKRMLLITGPNMAGKSTVMRQTALIVLMAQAGSFVPATEAQIGVADRIFTRVGASDALARGQSTFMVEMAEAAVILRDATERSLVVIDEIGRGTSTFDGLAIAWAVAEDLHDRVRARTLFATHYHELTDLARTREGVRTMNIAVREWKGEIVFLRRLVDGTTSRSYGIQVAKLAGLPEGVLGRATEVLENLEAGEFDEAGRPRLAVHHEASVVETAEQIGLFAAPVPSAVEERLHALDTTTITPLEALNLLHDLKAKL